MDQLKNDPEKTGKLYPRPTIKCSKCSDILILCWGKKVKLYLKHKSITTNNSGRKGHKEMSESRYIKWQKRDCVNTYNQLVKFQ